ncbi:class I SAM-dependent methyltransferase [Synechococcus sp. HJ21-Hayes]|uniref:methyltransferase n=1 Tax=unclassified Synechococcus TaxID=2626047 RepID=UPI0020CB9815|nr:MULTISPECIES: methyltransferase [unclassified Synechococcus]MCP9830274.1 class I SAM-dependent methyltransferase [Synechococcus sp. JJ3a-Johnson]MCP9853001.1 class I SAM-dependent methyltransferase [Synechococcus sp. HJ21-Hayes]
MTTLQLLPHRSDARLAALATQHIIGRLTQIESVIDIGCGDGVVGTLLPERCRYRGIDLSNATIYKQNQDDTRIIYSAPEELESLLSNSEPADAVLMLDVLEHTRTFSELFKLAIPLANNFLIVSLPNELFLLDRLRLLAGKEHPAHSLDLINLPEGFKHQFIINISKARHILNRIAIDHGFRLSEEWVRPLIAKNKAMQPLLWITRQISSPQVWSMGSIFVFSREA